MKLAPRSFFAAAALIASASIARATDGTWAADADGTWSNAGSWTSGTVADGVDGNANFVFNITGTRTVTLDTSRTIGNLTFTDATTASNNWVLASSGGSVLTLGLTTGTPVISVTNQTATISASLAGTQGIQKTGAGTLVLSGANTYSGGTTVTAGTLTLGASGSLGSGALLVNGGTFNSGGFAVSPDTVTVSSGTANFTGSASTGAVTLSGGALNVTGATLASSGAVTISGGTLTVSGTGGALTAGAVALTGGTLSGGSTSVGSVSGTSYALTGTGSATISAILSGSAGLTMSSTATLNLTGANTFSGGVTLASGTIRVGTSDAALGTGTLNVTGNATVATSSGLGARNLANAVSIGSGATLTTDGGFAKMTLSGNLSGAGNFAKTSSGIVLLTGVNTYAGTTNTGASGVLLTNSSSSLSGYNVLGQVTVAAGGAIGVSVGGAGQWTSTDIDTLVANATFAGATSGLGFDTTGGDFTYGSVISGAKALVKTGANTLTLSGANTYTGATTIGLSGLASGGTLKLSGSGAIANSAVTIFGGALDLNGATQAVTSLTLGGAVNGSTAQVLINGGVLNLGGNITYSATNNNNGAVISGGTLNLNAARTFTVGDSANATADLTISALVANGTTAGALTKAGTGTLVMTAANTFSGGFIITGGTVALGDNAALGTGAINLNAANVGIRSADAAARTIANAITFSNSTIFGSAGTGNLTFTGTISTGAAASSTKNFTVAQGVNTQFTGVVADGANTSNLIKDGAGTLVFSGANTTGKNMAVNAGTLTLDYSTQDNSKLSDTGALTLGTGALQLSGGTHSEIVASTTLTGASAISQTGGSATINLNTITRNAGGTVNFSAAGIGTTDNLNTNGILGGWATVGGADWAVNSTNAADGAVTALSSYTADTWAAGNNTDVATSQAIGSATTNSLRFNTAAVNTLTLTGTNTVTSGGILVTSAVGANASTITGGTLTGAAGADLVVIQNNTAASLAIASVVADNTSATGLTKAGAGTLVLSGTNTYTGQTLVTGGVLSIASDANLGATGQLVSIASSSTASTAVTLSSATLPTGFGVGSTLLGQTVTAVSGTSVTLGGNASVAISSATNVSYLSSANNLVLNGGTLMTTASMTLREATGAAANRNVVIGAAGGGFNVTTGTLTLAGTTNATALNGGTVVKSGAGNLLLNNGLTTTSGAMVLVDVQGGTLSLDNNSNSTAYTLFTSGTNGTLQAGSGTTINLVSTNNSGFSSAKNITLGSTLVMNGAALNGGSTNGATFESLTAATALQLSGTNTIAVSSGNFSQNLTISGAITGTGALNLNRANSNFRILNLKGDMSSYSGNVTIGASSASGYVIFGSASGWGSGSLTLTGAGSNVLIGDESATAYNPSWSGGTAINFTEGTLATNAAVTVGAGANLLLNNWTGPILFEARAGMTVNGGNLGYNAATGGAVATGVTSGNSAFVPYQNTTWTFGGSALSTVSANVQLNYSGATLQVADAVAGSGVDTTVSGKMSGAFGFTKTGAGTLLLSGVNTYAGATVVNAGQLSVSGTVNINGASGVTIASGASVVLSGVLKATTGADTVANAGSFTAGGVLNLNGLFDSFNGGAAGTYTLITGAGSNAGTFTSITGYNTSVWSNVAYASGVLTFTAVPEPATYGLLGAGALAGAAFVRRRKRRMV